jgi:hypothetical protein
MRQPHNKPSEEDCPGREEENGIDANTAGIIDIIEARTRGWHGEKHLLLKQLNIGLGINENWMTARLDDHGRSTQEVGVFTKWGRRGGAARRKAAGNVLAMKGDYRWRDLEFFS